MKWQCKDGTDSITWDGINLLETLLRLLRNGKWVSLPHDQSNQQIVAVWCTMWRHLGGCSAQVAQTALCWFPWTFQGIGKEGGAHMPSVCYSWATRISQGCPQPFWSSSPMVELQFLRLYEGAGCHSVLKNSACVWEAPVLHAAYPLLCALSSVNHSRLLDVTPILLKQCPWEMVTALVTLEDKNGSRNFAC